MGFSQFYADINSSRLNRNLQYTLQRPVKVFRKVGSSKLHVILVLASPNLLEWCMQGYSRTLQTWILEEVKGFGAGALSHIQMITNPVLYYFTFYINLLLWQLSSSQGQKSRIKLLWMQKHIVNLMSLESFQQEALIFLNLFLNFFIISNTLNVLL